MREVLLPQFGMGMANGTITAWHAAVGSQVREGDILFDVEAEKASVEVPAPCDGLLSEIRVEAGTTVEVRAVVAIIDDGMPPVAPVPSLASRPAAPAPSPTLQRPPGRPDRRDMRQVEPRARRLAKDHAVDLERVAGTGPGGRVVEEDVASFLDRRDRSGSAAGRLEVDAEYDGAALNALLAEIESSRPGLTLYLPGVFARLISLAAERADVAPSPMLVRTNGGDFVDCHRRPISASAPAQTAVRLAVFARLTVLRSDTIRHFAPVPGDEALTVSLVAGSQGAYRLCLLADPAQVDQDGVLAILSEIATLMETPIALLV